MDAIRLIAGQGNYELLEYLLMTTERLHLFPPEARYYLGEAYRVSTDKSIQQKALQHFEAAQKANPSYAPIYRSLGMSQMQSGEDGAAERSFRKYLSLASDATDRAYIEHYLLRLSGD